MVFWKLCLLVALVSFVKGDESDESDEELVSQFMGKLNPQLRNKLEHLLEENGSKELDENVMAKHFSSGEKKEFTSALFAAIKADLASIAKNHGFIDKESVEHDHSEE